MNVQRLSTTGRTVAAAVLGGLLALSAAAAGAAAAGFADHKIAVVLINFTDDKIDSSSAFRTKVRDMYFGSGTSLARYYEEASNGAVRFAPLPGQADVLGPFTINAAAKCDAGVMRTKTREILSANGIAQFDSLAVWFPNRLARCDWGGLGEMPGSTTWMPDEYGNPSGVVHELGHNFGFDHLGTVTCSAGTLSNCADAGYRGSSPMGGGGYQSGLAAPELLHKGWLAPAQHVTVAESGTYTLVPLHAADSVTGTRVLEIPRDPSGKRITVAYRKNGTTIDVGVGEGVQLHLTEQGRYGRSDLVDPSPATTDDRDTDLDVGARITDNGTVIETVSASATSATVRITVRTGAH
ncbi:hypothetical protein GCM10010123_45530 [Pilimelia anulata]|uniref:Peptidase M11 gametolysin domain-containing protein n=1 Tax=Pilimelia anulata TaxID=53371 RepID=A0A8J3BBW3_9ACTN|nr:hypothetical protein [Pilimelia anulata]GGK10465.1 hypothetical protein GCM10010123_45530 [Pilimelia anulata]